MQIKASTYFLYDFRGCDKSRKIRTITSILTTVLAHEYRFFAEVPPSSIDSLRVYFQPPLIQLRTRFRALSHILTKISEPHLSLFWGYPRVRGQILQKQTCQNISLLNFNASYFNVVRNEMLFQLETTMRLTSFHGFQTAIPRFPTSTGSNRTIPKAFTDLHNPEV